MKENKKEIIKLLLKLSVIIAIMILAIVYYDELTHIDVRQLVASSSSEITAGLSVVGVYALKGIVFVIPASLIYISVGMAFSPLTAVIVNIAGISVEVIVSYLFGLMLGGEYVENLLKKNKGGRKLLELKAQNRQSSIFIIRLLPVFPIDFASLFFGSVKFSFPKYLILSVLGIAPRVILFTLLGDKVYDLIPMTLIIKIIIAVIPVAVIAILAKWIYSRKKNNKEQ
ncbi:MAG: VTT domain-containing protein [Clostridia bacterium]|nr:VTT domain-containing protein [Clostridia bacterium]